MTITLNIRTYLWGLDNSGSRDGLAGIGGLLAYTDHTADAATTIYLCSDANGNIVAGIDADTGQVTGTREYEPFGKLLSRTGSGLDTLPFGFSSRYRDAATGLYYYGYRWYDPETGRWLSPDPIQEDGGLNLYAFCHNDPINKVDPLGLDVYLVYREFNDPLLQKGYNAIGHFFIAFDDKGVDPLKWRELVYRLSINVNPRRRVNPLSETFSFHPWEVRDGEDKCGSVAGILFTMGSYVGYKDRVDQLSFLAARDGSDGYPQALAARIWNLGVTEEQQFRIYEEACRSRDCNNTSRLSGDFGWYMVLINNCGSWAREIIEKRC